jgi:hypothetical protein
MSSNTMGFEDYGYRVVVVALLLIVMQTLMVTGRLVSRRLQKVRLGADDYVLVSATVSLSILVHGHLF